MFSEDLEIIGGIITISALLFAIFEAMMKYYGKNADKKTDFYTKYLHICQQLEIGFSSAKKMIDLAKEKSISTKTIVGFAKTHMLSEDLFKCIYDYQELAILCLNTKDNSEIKKALEFGAHAISIGESVNAFFESIIVFERQEQTDKEHLKNYLRSEATKKALNNIKTALKRLKDNEDKPAGSFFPDKNNLRSIMYNTAKQQLWRSKHIHIIYFVLIMLLVVLCVIYIVVLHLNLSCFPFLSKGF